MKKSLLVVVALAVVMAFAATANAWYYGLPCDLDTPVWPTPPCKDQVLCKGAAKGAIPLCGPCPGVVTYKASWKTVMLCPKKPKMKK